MGGLHHDHMNPQNHFALCLFDCVCLSDQQLDQLLSDILDSSSGHSGTGSGESAPASLHVQVVLNPLSKAAQRTAPILEWLRTSFHASIKVRLAS